MADTADTKPGVKDLFGVIRKSPALMVTLLVLVVGIAFLLIRSKKAGSSQIATATTGDSSTVPATQSQGSYYQQPSVTVEPIIYTPTPVVNNTNTVTVNPPVPGTTPHPPVVILPPPRPPIYIPPEHQKPPVPVKPPIMGFPPKAPAVTTGTIRKRGGNPVVSVYDKNTPGGVPVRATPGGKQIGLDAYGSSITLDGPEVAGKNNLPGVKGGTDEWYKTSTGGYVSAFDVSSTYTNSTATIPANTSSTPKTLIGTATIPSNTSVLPLPSVPSRGTIPSTTGAIGTVPTKPGIGVIAKPIAPPVSNPVIAHPVAPAQVVTSRGTVPSNTNTIQRPITALPPRMIQKPLTPVVKPVTPVVKPVANTAILNRGTVPANHG